MKILFVHNNFPAQFRNLVTNLAASGRAQMAAIGCETARSMVGVDLHRYRTPAPVLGSHAFARRFDHECRRAEQVLYAAAALASSGFMPDLILVHPGWGENLPLRAVFPNARIVVYCEFFYRSFGQDVDFDPEFPKIGLDGHAALHARNASSLIALAEGDAGLSPTQWQKNTYPADFQPKISVIHEGVDTKILTPDAEATFTLPSGRKLGRSDEVVTYCGRNLEPIRGFHIFMRSLPRVLEARPNAEIIVIGGDSVSYGSLPPNCPSWREEMLRELGDSVDLARVHFVGRLSYGAYMQALQISSAHVYLTYPFVLSWSLLEAMSMECAIIASDTAPVREVIDASNGVLVPFSSPAALSEAILSVLAEPQRSNKMRKAARQTIQQRYDAETVCIPALLNLLTTLSEP